MTEQLPPLPIPPGGFKTDRENAEWLARTIAMRTNESLKRSGVKVVFQEIEESLVLLIMGLMKDAVDRADIDGSRRREAQLGELLSALAIREGGKIMVSARDLRGVPDKSVLSTHYNKHIDAVEISLVVPDERSVN